jgi:hypothetical protein
VTITAAFASGTFPEGRYIRQCPSCKWGARQEDFDESPPMLYCPRCGIKLVRQECANCGAPVLFGPKMSKREEGKVIIAPLRRCAWCGESPILREPRMRRRPRRKIPVLPPPPANEDA